MTGILTGRSGPRRLAKSEVVAPLRQGKRREIVITQARGTYYEQTLRDHIFMSSTTLSNIGVGSVPGGSLGHALLNPPDSSSLLSLIAWSFTAFSSQAITLTVVLAVSNIDTISVPVSGSTGVTPALVENRVAITYDFLNGKASSIAGSAAVVIQAGTIVSSLAPFRLLMFHDSTNSVTTVPYDMSSTLHLNGTCIVTPGTIIGVTALTVNSFANWRSSVIWEEIPL